MPKKDSPYSNETLLGLVKDHMKSMGIKYTEKGSEKISARLRGPAIDAFEHLKKLSGKTDTELFRYLVLKEYLTRVGVLPDGIKLAKEMQKDISEMKKELSDIKNKVYGNI